MRAREGERGRGGCGRRVRHGLAILGKNGRTLWNSSQDTIQERATPSYHPMEVGFRSHQERPRHSAAPHPGFFYLKIYFITGGAGETGSTGPLLLVTRRSTFCGGRVCRI